jgi:hypothetical protein
MPTGRWHLDEMVVKISDQRMYLWRAVDDEGEVLDVLVQQRRNKAADVAAVEGSDEGATHGEQHFTDHYVTPAEQP